jgi:zinc transporter, ZIP family
MSAPSTTTSQTHPKPGGALWGLALLPVLLLGLVLTYLVATGGGLTQLSGPPVEKLRIQRVTLPRPGMMTVEVINDGPEELTIAQIQVDDAFWTFSAAPSNTLPRFGAATFSIPYPWVREEAHMIVLLTNIGTTFQVEVPVAVQTPQIDASLLWRFALVGLYVGVVPVALGLLWYPFMKRMGRRAMNAVLALTIGLLGYLAIGTYLDAQEFAIEVPTFWQGLPLVIISAVHPRQKQRTR